MNNKNTTQMHNKAINKKYGSKRKNQPSKGDWRFISKMLQKRSDLSGICKN